MPKTKLRWFDVIYLGILLGFAVCLALIDNLVASCLIGMLIGGHCADMGRHQSEALEDEELMELLKKQEDLIVRLMVENNTNFFKKFDEAMEKFKKMNEKPVEGDEWKHR